MTYQNETPSRFRMPSRGQLMQARHLAGPAMVFARRNPVILIGAAVLGVAGMMAWRNRERIAARAQPMIDEARTRGQAMIEDAKVRGEELIDQARTAGEAVAAKAGRKRKATGAAASDAGPTDFH
jgi:hypothetical protein